VGEDRVRHLRDGVEAFPAMIDAIDGATREVLLEMYWVGADAVGELFRAALTRAARRGVEVRVIYDSLGSIDVSLGWWQSLVDAGGEVFEFHPVSPLRREFRIKLLEQRDHRKLLVVDGQLGFTGGLNLGREWLPLAEGGLGWRDDIVSVAGPAAQELRTLFYRTRRRLVPGPPPADVAPLLRMHPRPVWVLATRALPQRLIRREYLRRIQGARARIDIANPYFVPDRRVRRALGRAVARGVRVRVLVPEKGDVAVVHFAVEALFDTLLRKGIEVYSLPGPMLHCKTAVIDDFTTIGSYNLDERSWRKNLEVNLAVSDRAFALHVRSSFERDVASATRLNLAGWRLRSRGKRAAEVVARMFWKLL
jgi:cardiolipin synthase